MNKIKKVLLVCIGFLISFYIFFIRLLQHKVPKELETNLYLKSDFLQIFIYICLIILFVYLVVKNYQVIIGYETNKKGFFINNLGALGQLANESLRTFNVWLVQYTFLNNYSYLIPKNIGLFLFKHFCTTNRIVLLFSMLIVVPKVIVLYSFAIDILYYHKFEFVYKASILLLFPIVERYLFYTLEHFCKENCLYFDETLLIIETKSTNILPCKHYIDCLCYQILKPSAVYFLFTQSFLEKHKDISYNTEKSLNFNLEVLHDELLPTHFFETFYTLTKNSIIPRFHFILYFNYFLLWTYVLYYVW